jgi:hypothetical protein
VMEPAATILLIDHRRENIAALEGPALLGR